MATSTVKESTSIPPTADVARVAGRGTVYITAAKIWFIASGAGIYFILPNFLMSPAEFGLYQVVTVTVSIINAVIITGTYQTVSKYISQEVDKADAVKRKALQLQTLVGGAAALGFFLLAPVIAAYLNDPRLTNYLRLAALITLSYSFYAVFTGYFNGQKKFLTQAGLDMTYSTLKLACIVLLVWLGFGVMGGVGGFALAAAGILAISALAAGRGRPAGDVRAADLFKFQSYLLLFTLVLNLLQKVDLMLVKALSSADATTASENAGFYGAAVYLANLTYQIIISATFVIFPLVSQATFSDDRRSTQAYIANTLRYTLMIMAPVGTLLSANAGEVLHVIFKPEYQNGGGALAFVAYGMVLFGWFQIITTIISASGRPRVSLTVGALTLAACAALNAALIPAYGITGAGVGTTAAMLIGVIAGGGYLLAKYGTLMPPLSALRIAACSGLIYAASLALAPASKVLIVAQLAGLGVIYIVALVLTGEVGRAELAVVKKVIKR